jgi:hypothetical protein
MCIRKSLLVAAALAIVGAVCIASVSASTAWSNPNYLTFNTPFGLPGVTLPAGTYTFRTNEQDRNVVQVLNRAETKSYYMGITRPIQRPSGNREQPLVSMGEAPRGQVQPVQIWFPAGEDRGHGFIYER